MSVKSIIFLGILGLTMLSSWLVTRRSRAILKRSLGREIRDGEETSLRAWMSVPDATLSTAHEELSGHPAERAIDAAAGLMSRAHAREPRNDGRLTR
jgi:hypothetical protein